MPARLSTEQRKGRLVRPTPAAPRRFEEASAKIAVASGTTSGRRARVDREMLLPILSAIDKRCVTAPARRCQLQLDSPTSALSASSLSPFRSFPLPPLPTPCPHNTPIARKAGRRARWRGKPETCTAGDRVAQRRVSAAEGTRRSARPLARDAGGGDNEKTKWSARGKHSKL